MAMEQDLVTRLLANPAVAALAAAAVGWDQRPRGRIAPSVVLTLVSGVVDSRDDGADPVEMARVQADFIGADDEQLIQLEAAVRAVMESGDPIDGTVTGGTRFWPGERTRRAGPETEDLPDQQTLRRRYSEFEFYFQAI